VATMTTYRPMGTIKGKDKVNGLRKPKERGNKFYRDKGPG